MIITSSRQIPDFNSLITVCMAFLDGKIRNWPELVDLEKLDMSSSGNCVARQVTLNPNFGHAMGDLGINCEQAHAMGFLILSHLGSQKTEEIFATANRLWKERIKGRQELIFGRKPVFR